MDRFLVISNEEALREWFGQSSESMLLGRHTHVQFQSVAPEPNLCTKGYQVGPVRISLGKC